MSELNLRFASQSSTQRDITACFNGSHTSQQKQLKQLDDTNKSERERLEVATEWDNNDGTVATTHAERLNKSFRRRKLTHLFGRLSLSLSVVTVCTSYSFEQAN